MSRLAEGLRFDESILHRARIHWFIFAPAAILVVLALFLSGDLNGYTSRAIAAIAMLLAIPVSVIAGIMKGTTEIVVTSKRLIVRRGALRSDKFEIQLDAIERTSVHQGVVGRLLNFGTIVVMVSGGRSFALDTLHSPALFAEQIAVATDEYRQR
jgi:uncharacterized membrane protein YdbT with pleckstrin-like domain